MQQGFIILEMSLRGVPRNFGLKVGAISRAYTLISVRPRNAPVPKGRVSLCMRRASVAIAQRVGPEAAWGSASLQR